LEIVSRPQTFERRSFAIRVKVSGHAKNLPHEYSLGHWFCNTLGMALHMLLVRTDEVARNGAFGKILRPEVFPDAPLQKETPFVAEKSRSA
jgi:hypothetical protein